MKDTPTVTWAFSCFHVRMPHVHELHECDKIVLTPDSNDWNPHCVSFENNERSMINIDGELATNDRRLMQPQLFPPNDSKVAISTVSLNEWEEYKTKVASSAFSTSCLPQDAQIHDSTSQFAEAISERGEISKFSASIGSVTTYSQRDSTLFDSNSNTVYPKLVHLSNN